MKKILLIFLVAILAIGCNSDKEKELLERELELAKRELELSKKESQGNDEKGNTKRTTYNAPAPEPVSAPRVVDHTASIRSREKYNPMDYLKMDFNYKGQSYQKGKGILKIRTETKYKHYAEVSIYNNAIYTTYRNATIEVKYLSNNGNIVGTQRFKMNKYLNPKKSSYSKYALTLPNGVSRVKGSLINVSTVN